MQITLCFMQKRGTQNSFSFSNYEPGMFELHTARFHSTAAGLWILMNFCPCLSNTFRVKRSPKKSPLSDLSPVGAHILIRPPLPLLSDLTLVAATDFLLHCRIRRWWTKPPPTRRTSTPQTRRSWPPPPATSGPPCRTWTRN